MAWSSKKQGSCREEEWDCLGALSGQALRCLVWEEEQPPWSGFCQTKGKDPSEKTDRVVEADRGFGKSEGDKGGQVFIVSSVPGSALGTEDAPGKEQTGLCRCPVPSFGSGRLPGQEL